jgi:hypothetical protein
MIFIILTCYLNIPITFLCGVYRRLFLDIRTRDDNSS